MYHTLRVILGALRTCSSLQPSLNCEYGLFTECLWFLEAMKRVNKNPSEQGEESSTNLCKMFFVTSVLLKVFLSSVVEHSGSSRTTVLSEASFLALLSFDTKEGSRRDTIYSDVFIR